MKSVGQHAEIAELVDERVPVAVLQRVVETLFHELSSTVSADDRQFNGDHRREQNAARPASSERK